MIVAGYRTTYTKLKLSIDLKDNIWQLTVTDEIKSTVNTVVHVHHVLADNIDMKKLSSSIKLQNTCNRYETAWKGAMNFPDRLHKGLMYEIIRRDALGFIEHDKDDHQEEE